MRLIRFEKDVFDVTDGKELRAETDYIILRNDIGHYAGASDGYLTVTPYAIQKPFEIDRNWNGKQLIVHRSGHTLDLNLILPVLRELKKKWPSCSITLHTEEQFHWVLGHTQFVDAYLAPPLTYENLTDYDCELDLEGDVDFDLLERNRLAINVYTALTGIVPSDNHTLAPIPPFEQILDFSPKMRAIRFSNHVMDAGVGKRLQADTEYVIPREVLSYYANLSEGFLTVCSYEIPNRFTADQDWNDKRILIHRSGSAGDLLFITPLLRELKHRWPRCQIAFDCEQRYHWVFKDNPHVETLFCPPMARELVDGFDAQIDLESASEFSPWAKKLVLTDVYATAAGLTLANNKTDYVPHPLTVEKIAARFPKTVKRVGISLISDGVLRNYPRKLSLQVIGALMRSNIQVVLLGKESSGVARQPLFIDLAGERPTLSWDESVAFMTTCDLILGPDSSAIHFAGAMGVPSLGLFGPFPADLRIPPQPATRAIQGTGLCAPCFHHGRGGVSFPSYGPCALTGQCEVLASIRPEHVVSKILEIIGGES